MSEPRKNHLTIDGGTVKEDDHIATYKPIPETDTELRISKSNLSKSKEKVTDEAEEKLLDKSEEAKITTRVDMADAKYIVGDHRNGDAKIELDANKRQFTGLTKEELMKYADDPFWVRTRWVIFIMFWALWLAMLAGAIIIIYRAPKCTLTPKTWYQEGPLVDLNSGANPASYGALETSLPALKAAQVKGVFIAPPGDAYQVLEDQTAVGQLKDLVKKAKDQGVRIILDLTANFVSKSHKWFELSENRTAGYENYFVWAVSRGGGDATKPHIEPNNWRSTYSTSAWSWSEKRQEFYLHQYREEEPDLNFNNQQVRKHFEEALKIWMGTGIAGVRLVHGRQLLIDSSLADEQIAQNIKSDAVHTNYSFYKHDRTSDQPNLNNMLMDWALIVDNAYQTPGSSMSVFTLKEPAGRLALHLSHNLTSLRPPSVAPVTITGNVASAVNEINAGLKNSWPALQLTCEPDTCKEITAFAMLLPAAPILTLQQIPLNDTKAHEKFVTLRADASVQHGHVNVTAVNGTSGPVLVCTRWKTGHNGYVSVYNPQSDTSTASLSSLTSVPESISVYYVTDDVYQRTNYTADQTLKSSEVKVPGKSTVIFLYAPKTTVES